MYWDFVKVFLAGIDRAKEYNLVWEFVSAYMTHRDNGQNAYTATYNALLDWDLLL